MPNGGYPPGTKLGPSGYPAGSLPDTPYATPIPADQLGKALKKEIGGGGRGPPLDDVAFQPPSSPLAGVRREGEPSIVYRDVPNISTITSWTVQNARGALQSLMQGIFELSGQFADAMLGDDRIQATLGSRIDGLWGREARHVPSKIKRVAGSRAAQECFDAWVDHWQNLEDCYGFGETAVYTILMGWGHGQVVWDTSDTVWKPYPRPWHPRYEFYHWPTRRYAAITQDGLFPVIPGNGKWYACEPYGSYRAWVRGALRALTEPWLGLRFARRDWWRFNEVHGLPTRVGYTPAAADPGQRSAFEQNLGQLGSEACLLIPRGVDKDMGYGYELVEAADTNWESFERTINECHLAIVLAIKFQNLTTEVTAGGSYAAAKQHGQGEIGQVASDNRVWKGTIYRDFARPFAMFNFGDADLAPTTDRDVPVPARDDYAQNSEVFVKIGQAVASLVQSGMSFGDPETFGKWLADRFGLRDFPALKVSESPAMVTANAAKSTSDAAHKTGDAALKQADNAEKKANEVPAGNENAGSKGNPEEAKKQQK